MGLDVADEDVVEYTLGVEAHEVITFVDFGVCGVSCTSIALAADGEGMTNCSGRK